MTKQRALWIVGALVFTTGCDQTNRRSAGGGGRGGGDNNEAPVDAGPQGEEDTGTPVEIPSGGIILPDCEDRDQDGYGVGSGCRGADFNDEDRNSHPGASEICDGNDNDGDGSIDLDDDDFAPERCPLAEGVCFGSHAPCVEGVSQPCDAALYGDDFLQDEDRVCDGKDNDCDGQRDEGCDCQDTPPQERVCPDDACSDQTCRDGQWGPCVRHRNPEPELCDGKDNDCDGQIDEPPGELQPPLCGACPFEMMYADTNNLDFCIDRYEASREDATGVHPGAINGNAHSRPGVLPWTSVDRGTARAACRAVDKELCTAAQWQTACMLLGRVEDPPNPDWLYPYGEAYDGQRCNGADAQIGAPRPVAAMAACIVDTDRGAFDLSGNVREWIEEKIGGERAAFGGSYVSPPDELRCDHHDSLAGSHEDLETGFRCCIPLPNF